MQIVRQGDILIVKLTTGVDVSTLAKIPREGTDVVLAHGEATGHRHRFAGKATQLYSPWPEKAEPSERVRHARELLARLLAIDAEGAVLVGVLDVRERDTLLHEEHSAIPLEPGKYAVMRQRTYTPEAIVVVAD
jgi:hypothetical protein